MYSRNLDKNGISNYKKNNLEVRKMTTPGLNQKQDIPVKSFTDNFAYERFNKIDNQLQKSRDETANSETENMLPERNEADREKELSASIVEKTADISDSKKIINEKKISLKEIINFDNLYDSDLIFLALAAAITVFGNKENNDKLTPIALLAIIFL